ncbi:MAG: helix-turn-helix transcriptional regulator [Gorillibacterium sp.]|nr:helix-turn-helix transcriptional regulator [Gorillibacterium sp.]
MNTYMLRQAGDFIVKPGWSLGPRMIDDYELVYFPEPSQTVYRTNTIHTTIKQPCFILTRPGERHMYAFDPSSPTRHLFVHFAKDVSDSLYEMFQSITSPVISALHHPILQHMMKYILYLAHEEDGSGSCDERCSKLLDALFSELDALHQMREETSGLSLLAGKTHLPNELRNAQQFMDKHLEEELKVSAIADYVGWSHEHFTRVFTKHFGYSPRAAVLMKRLDKACLLLTAETWSIQVIAKAVGFVDPLYFSRCFTKIKGMSASKYRRLYSDPRIKHLSYVGAQIDVPYPMNEMVNRGI